MHIYHFINTLNHGKDPIYFSPLRQPKPQHPQSQDSFLFHQLTKCILFI